MCKSNIEKPGFHYFQAAASRHKFFQIRKPMLMALCTTIAIGAAQAADGLPDSGAQVEFTAAQELLALNEAEKFSPLDETRIQEEKLKRIDQIQEKFQTLIEPDKFSPEDKIRASDEKLKRVDQIQEKFQTLIDSGIFSPEEKTYTPDEKLTRAELMQKLAELLESAPSTAPLPDVFGPVEIGVIESPALPMVAEGIDNGRLEGQHDFLTLAELMEKMAGMQRLIDGIPPDTGMPGTEVSEQLASLLPSLWNELQREVQLSEAYEEQRGGLNQSEFPYVDAGVVTPRSSWPTALNATYNGRITGALTDSTPVTGSLTMTVDFAQINSMAANIPGSIVFDNGKGSASFNLMQMGGYVGNAMSGTYDGEAMTGYMRDGQFYGPAANEIAGKWDMTTNSVSGGGTYAAKR